jgi:hypothetical protein
MQNLREADVAAELVVVVQTKGDADRLDLDFLHVPGVEVLATTRFSASAARNLGLDRLRSAEPRFLCFLDSDAVPSVGLLRSVRSYFSGRDRILIGRAHWYEGDPAGRFSDVTTGRPTSIGRLLFSTYLWSTFLPTSYVVGAGIRFDESIGPGEETRLKAGEDVLLLSQVVLANEVEEAVLFDAGTLHPRRPSDFSKHLTYAEGQGALFVRLLRSRLPRSLKARVLASFGLFLGNALVRVLTFRRRSLPILRLRLRGALEGFRLETISS